MILALRAGVALIVVGLNHGPVIAASALPLLRVAEPFLVVRDRGWAQIEHPCDLLHSLAGFKKLRTFSRVLIRGVAILSGAHCGVVQRQDVRLWTGKRRFESFPRS